MNWRSQYFHSAFGKFYPASRLDGRALTLIVRFAEGATFSGPDELAEPIFPFRLRQILPSIKARRSSFDAQVRFAEDATFRVASSITVHFDASSLPSHFLNCKNGIAPD
jgi:hypothetical protein